MTTSGQQEVALDDQHKIRRLVLAAGDVRHLWQGGQTDAAAALLSRERGLSQLVEFRDGAMELTPEFDTILLSLTGDPPVPTLPAIAELLSRRPWLEGADAASRDLTGLVVEWNRQRLWADNRARELVVHDERHTQRVDFLASQLVAPLLADAPARLTVPEAKALSAAAWLHDWGHEGGEISAHLIGGGAPLVAERADDVRTLHGIITRELLGPEWKGRHRLDEPTANVVGILSAHHQGWTSFNRQVSSRTVHDGRRVVPPSLAADTAAHNALFSRSDSPLATLGMHRVQLLAALLRVADGCDVGVHRVPDQGVAKHAFLARAVQLRCRQARVLIEYANLTASRREDVIVALAQVSQVARSLSPGRPLGYADQEADTVGLVEDMLRKLRGLDDVPAVTDLTAYIEHAANTSKFYRWHLRVAHVFFDVVRVAGDVVPFHIRVLVRPSIEDLTPPVEGLDAVGVVAHDLRAELDRGDRLLEVRDVLLEAGLRFIEVASVNRPSNGKRVEKLD